MKSMLLKINREVKKCCGMSPTRKKRRKRKVVKRKRKY